MNLNQDLIRTRCQDIEESLTRLEQVKLLPKEVFLNDQDVRDIACYRLLVAIEAALGLCYHVAAKGLKQVPQEYAECFALLADSGIIPPDLAESLQKMARFRNLLVHMYWKVEHGTVYELLQHKLEDLRTFSRAVVALI